ncbi:hypothetical protein ACOT81_18870 [Streptomyces sp. WI04-05B]|uniref:hypothetical protein n=1 Tax=Streptomyces TaxID=1883 RepID=UPI0029BD51E8|nr:MULTISPECIES: hypothetical protein [unclassified Streptomyces]MDX2542552.1 hypothetical protein [Streptomyces sp. WI04-05B]MDX2582429.1 hypothetical protein [Streptomyces sp. WI04-05A]MDX3747842.1 hypothetical protein [Streptomyces sp. AK08-02]
MKIQERTGAGGGRSSVPAPPMSGERLPTPPRERKPALAALAVLLILLGALGATTLVLRAGDRIEVIKVTAEIPAGGSVSKANTTAVMVAADTGINYVEWTQLDTLKTLKARSTIYEGTVVMGQMFGSDGGVAAGQATVGLSLKEGQYPTGIKAGDLVAAYRVGSTTGTGSSTGSSGSSSSGAGTTVIVDKAKVTFVQNTKDSDVISSTNLPVTLTVDAAKAADLAQAAAAGQVALVLIPSS